MSDLKNELIDLLKLRNVYIDEFKTSTLSCVTTIEDYEDDLDKATKYGTFVEDREEWASEIKKIDDKIASNPEMNVIYESQDQDIVLLRNVYKECYKQIVDLQPRMNQVGENILGEMRSNFKKIKQSQTFNTHYFDSPDTSGTKFDAQQ